MGWACAQTRGNLEAKAVVNLKRQGFEAFCPYFFRPVLGKPGEYVKRPLFPCYVFVSIGDAQQWRSIDGTYGVIRLLTNHSKDDPKPLFIESPIVDKFAVGEYGELTLDAGTVVRIKQKDSAFYDHVGTVVSMDAQQRVSVLMTMFNRDVVVDFASAASLESV